MNEISRNLVSINTLIQSKIDAAKGLSAMSENPALMADELSGLIGGNGDMEPGAA